MEKHGSKPMYNRTEYEDLVPTRFLDGLDRWAKEGTPPGGFLMAVLKNDLCDAVGRADGEALMALRKIVTYANCQLPDACWGSKQAYEDWRNPEAVKARKELREKMMQLKDKVDSEELDLIIHNCKGEEAAEINNSGIEAQLEYLLDWVKPDEVIELLAERRSHG